MKELHRNGSLSATLDFPEMRPCFQHASHLSLCGCAFGFPVTAAIVPEAKRSRRQRRYRQEEQVIYNGHLRPFRHLHHHHLVVSDSIIRSIYASLRSELQVRSQTTVLQHRSLPATQDRLLRICKSLTKPQHLDLLETVAHHKNITMADTLIKRAGNRALQTNPPNADIHLGRWGSDWAWTVFCVMALTTLGLLAWSDVVPKNRRTFHYLLIATLAVSSIAWWTMASDLGATPITVQFLRNSPFGSGYGGFPTRQIFYARYIDWFITTPLLLLSLLLITGCHSRSSSSRSSSISS